LEHSPKRDPYTWLAWTSADGPALLPTIPGAVVHSLIDRIQEWILSERPEMEEFRLERPPSPWNGGEGAYRWFPGTTEK
jgi:hypothetical protein